MHPCLPKNRQDQNQNRWQSSLLRRRASKRSHLRRQAAPARAEQRRCAISKPRRAPASPPMPVGLSVRMAVSQIFRLSQLPKAHLLEPAGSRLRPLSKAQGHRLPQSQPQRVHSCLPRGLRLRPPCNVIANIRRPERLAQLLGLNLHLRDTPCPRPLPV